MDIIPHINDPTELSTYRAYPNRGRVWIEAWSRLEAWVCRVKQLMEAWYRIIAESSPLHILTQTTEQKFTWHIHNVAFKLNAVEWLKWNQRKLWRGSFGWQRKQSTCGVATNSRRRAFCVKEDQKGSDEENEGSRAKTERSENGGSVIQLDCRIENL